MCAVTSLSRNPAPHTTAPARGAVHRWPGQYDSVDRGWTGILRLVPDSAGGDYAACVNTLPSRLAVAEPFEAATAGLCGGDIERVRQVPAVQRERIHEACDSNVFLGRLATKRDMASTRPVSTARRTRWRSRSCAGGSVYTAPSVTPAACLAYLRSRSQRSKPS
jgi:hypothetical protein